MKSPQTGWIFEDNVKPFLTILARLVGAEMSPDEFNAIAYGLRDSDVEKDNWYAFAFLGKQQIQFELAADPGASVVFFRVEAPENLKAKVEVAIEICEEFSLYFPNDARK